MRTRELGSYTATALGWLLLLAAGGTVFAGIDIFFTADGWIFDSGDGVLIMGVGGIMAAAGVALIRSGRRLRDKRR